MKSIPFPGATLQIGKGQPEYNVIHAMPVGGPEGEIIACFELTDEEVEQIVKTKKIFYSRWTFGGVVRCHHCSKVTASGFQPMRIFTELGDNIELVPENQG